MERIDILSSSIISGLTFFSNHFDEEQKIEKILLFLQVIRFTVRYYFCSPFFIFSYCKNKKN